MEMRVVNMSGICTEPTLNLSLNDVDERNRLGIWDKQEWSGSDYLHGFLPTFNLC